MVRVISGKIIKNMTEEKNRSVRVSGRFELSRLLVIEGKIAVNEREICVGSSCRESCNGNT